MKELRQRIEEGRGSVLVSGMGGIGKTNICKKLFEEYLYNSGNGAFNHIGFIEYTGNMDKSLENCLKYKKQNNPENNHEAAWRELEYLAADGKLLLFIDNVNVAIGSDIGLERLKSIPGALVLTSRRISFSKEFEPYKISFLSEDQCIVIYERILYEDSGKKVPEEEIQNLKYIINTLVERHTITIEFLAHLAQTKNWTVKKLRDELEVKGFQLKYRDEEDKFINIQEEYEKLYDLSNLTEAEQNILEAFSVFPYIPLAAETCNQWLIKDADISEEDDVLVGLYRKGWLQFDMEQDSYSLHPVFAQFICEKCKPRVENHIGMIAEFQKNLEISASSSGEQFYWHLLFAESFIGKMNPKGSELLSALEKTCCDLAKNVEVKLKEKNRQQDEKIRQQEEVIRQKKEERRQMEEERRQMEVERKRIAEKRKRFEKENILFKRVLMLSEKIKRGGTSSVIIMELLNRLSDYEGKELDIVCIYLFFCGMVRRGNGGI